MPKTKFKPKAEKLPKVIAKIDVRKSHYKPIILAIFASIIPTVLLSIPYIRMSTTAAIYYYMIASPTMLITAIGISTKWMYGSPGTYSSILLLKNLEKDNYQKRLHYRFILWFYGNVGKYVSQEELAIFCYTLKEYYEAIDAPKYGSIKRLNGYLIRFFEGDVHYTTLQRKFDKLAEEGSTYVIGVNEYS